MATISSSSSTYMGLALAANSSGCFDWVISDLDADNAFGLVITDANTVTSGYIQGYYVSMTSSGAYSTGNTQLNAIAVDMFLGGTVACEAEGIYVYIAGSGTPTLTSSNINGINIYIDDLGANGNRVSGIQLHWADDTTGAGTAAIYFRMEGSAPALNAFIEKGGTAAKDPTYFLAANSEVASTAGWIRAYTPSTASAYSLMCYINGTVYRIPIVADSCD
jgi:hypothetical protein